MAILVTVKEICRERKEADCRDGRRVHVGNHRANQARCGTRLSRRASEDAALLQAGLQARRAHRALPQSGGRISHPCFALFRSAIHWPRPGISRSITLAEHSNIIGIKDSSGNVQRVGEMIAGVPPAFQVLVGAAANDLPIARNWRARMHPSARMRAAGKMRCAIRIGPQGSSRKSPRIAGRFGSRFESHSLRKRHRRPETRHGSARLPRRSSSPAAQPLQPEQKTRLSEFMATLEPAVARA